MDSSIDVRASVAAALSAARPEDVIAGVKTAVADELGRLDPAVKIKFTDYFNHSFIPDMLIEWSDLGRRRERRVYLRSSIGATVANEDVESLAPLDPVMVGLTVGDQPDYLETARSQVQQAPQSLLTDVTAVAGIARQVQDDGAGNRAPLLELVRSSLLKGGRGLLTSVEAERLSTGNSEETPTATSLDAFDETADALFSGETATRLHRAADLLRGGFDQPPAATDEDGEEASTRVTGVLSDVELRVLLPYLLSRHDVTHDRAYWSAWGDLVSLDRLEASWDVLEGLDLSPLIKANAERWLAARSQTVLNSSVIDDDSAQPDTRWVMRGKVIGAEVGAWRILLASDARKLRGRDGGSPGRWDELEPHLRRFALTGVQLSGLSRSVHVHAERASDVFNDVRSIRANIQDDFHVPSATVRRLIDDSDDVAVEVDFMAMTASGRNATIASLVTAAGLLGYRQPISVDAVQELLS